MQLLLALRLSDLPRLAFTGAGGKTTALFRLARELAVDDHWKHATILVTATTHLAVEQCSLADHHRVVNNLDDLEDWLRSPLQGVVLLTGSLVEPERMSGLDPQLLEQILAFANERRFPLLIEADGSRQRPLKAPAEHEPVVPPWVDTVVVVAGLSGLDKPLNPQWVHRPERFAQISGLVPGHPINPQAVVRTLTSPLGGLKGIPEHTRRVVLLNQADTPELQATAQRMAKDLLGAYQAVLVAALASPIGEGVMAVRESVAGIVLAAGGSVRMGKTKQILPWRGKPLVEHVARVALQSELSPVVVVTGFAADKIQKALESLPVSIIHNPAWQAGLSTSVAAGVQALPAQVGAAIFFLADQPQVPPQLVRGLIALHSQTLAPLVAPEVAGKRANPVLFDQRTFPDLLSLKGDVGGRELFSRYPVTWLPWHDQTLTLDVDTPEDYERLQGLE